MRPAWRNATRVPPAAVGARVHDTGDVDASTLRWERRERLRPHGAVSVDGTGTTMTASSPAMSSAAASGVIAIATS